MLNLQKKNSNQKKLQKRFNNFINKTFDTELMNGPLKKITCF